MVESNRPGLYKCPAPSVFQIQSSKAPTNTTQLIELGDESTTTSGSEPPSLGRRQEPCATR